MMTVTEDYNGSYNITQLANISEGNSNFTLIQPGNSYENINPVMMSEDVPTANDMQPYPASCYFDVDGDKDIGAYGNSTGTDRTRGTIYVNGTGTPDYSTHDFMTINDAASAMCPSASTQPVNTLNVAAGTYLEQVRFENMDGITITGAGSGSTTIDSTGTGTDTTLMLLNVDNSTIKKFTLTAAATDPAALGVYSGSDGNIITDVILSGATTVTTAYTATRHPYTYDGNDYAENGVYFTHDNSGTPNDDFIWSSTTDDFPITDGIASTPQIWNLGLANNGSEYYTFYAAETERLDVNTTMFDTADSLNDYLDAFGAFDVDCWADDVFVWNGSSYGYTAPTGCAAGDPTLTAGYQTNPATPAVSSYQGGTLNIASSDSNNISSTTIQNATNAISLSGTAATNTIDTNMTFTSNTTDIKTFSTGDNTVTTDDYCATLNYLVVSTGKLLGCNTAPTVTDFSASQTSGTNTADVGVTIDDPDNDEVALQVQYGFYNGSCANTTEWTTASVPSTVSPVDTLNGSSTLSFIWGIISERISTSDGTYCLKVTATDDDSFTANSSTTITYTYQMPQVTTGGGTPIANISTNSTDSKGGDTSKEIDEEEKDEKESGEEAERISFSDTKNHKAEDEINKLIDEDVILGYEDGTFKPNDKLNRIEAAIFLYRLIEDEDPKTPTVKPFSDVDRDKWYAGYLSDLKGKGIVDGYGDGEFKPYKEVNYAEFTKMLLNTYSYKSDEETQSEIEELLEGKENGAWYVPSVDVSTSLGLIEESSNVEEKISRGEAVIILHDVFFSLTD
jgi:S-layer family protein